MRNLVLVADFALDIVTVLGTARFNALYQVRNNFTALADYHMATLVQPEVLHRIPVVTRNAGNSSHRKLHRLDNADRSIRTGHTDRRLDINKFSFLFFRRELIRPEIVRRLGCTAKTRLVILIVDLQHDTINRICLLKAAFAHRFGILNEFIQVRSRVVFRHFKAHRFKRLDIIRLVTVRGPLNNQVTDERKLTAFNFIRVVELKSTGRAVSRIGKRLLAFRDELVIVRFKVCIFPNNFTANFGFAGKRNLRFHPLHTKSVLKHRVADIILASRHRIDENPFLILKRETEAINLILFLESLNAIVEHTVRPFLGLFDTVRVLDGHHRDIVLYLTESRGAILDMTSRRGSKDERRVGRLELLDKYKVMVPDSIGDRILASCVGLGPFAHGFYNFGIFDKTNHTITNIANCRCHIRTV